MDHSRKMLRFRDMRLFSNPPTQHEALLRARSARSLRSQLPGSRVSIDMLFAMFMGSPLSCASFAPTSSK